MPFVWVVHDGVRAVHCDRELGVFGLCAGQVSAVGDDSRDRDSAFLAGVEEALALARHFAGLVAAEPDDEEGGVDVRSGTVPGERAEFSFATEDALAGSRVRAVVATSSRT
jgi:hypothetical protein